MAPKSAPNDGFDTIPKTATFNPSRFRVQIPDEQLKNLKTMLQMARVGPKTYENQDPSGKFGLTHQWLSETKTYWEKKYNWRDTEAYINSFTHYEVTIKDQDEANYTIHFTGLFSQNPEAVPIIMLHGWPGSFMEHLKLLQRLRGKYSPEELPYHVIVPSLPGYCFSSGPPLNKEFLIQDMARIMHLLMEGIGFKDGYVAQGGDIGAYIARIMAVNYDACKAMHINFCPMAAEPEGADDAGVTQQEHDQLARGKDFQEYGNAYARMHATRPATIGLVLSSNPLALLAWIGEKFLAWTDVQPSIDTILEFVTLYWLTDTFPRAIFPYAQLYGDTPNKTRFHTDPNWYCVKPFGYSYFPKEVIPVPVNWVRTTGNLIWSRNHGVGGHFASLEKPEIMLADIEDFIAELK